MVNISKRKLHQVDHPPNKATVKPYKAIIGRLHRSHRVALGPCAKIAGKWLKRATNDSSTS
jgi:hypothetical protein